MISLFTDVHHHPQAIVHTLLHSNASKGENGKVVAPATQERGIWFNDESQSPKIPRVHKVTQESKEQRHPLLQFNFLDVFAFAFLSMFCLSLQPNSHPRCVQSLCWELAIVPIQVSHPACRLAVFGRCSLRSRHALSQLPAKTEWRQSSAAVRGSFWINRESCVPCARVHAGSCSRRFLQGGLGQRDSHLGEHETSLGVTQFTALAEELSDPLSLDGLVDGEIEAEERAGLTLLLLAPLPDRELLPRCEGKCKLLHLMVGCGPSRIPGRKCHTFPRRCRGNTIAGHDDLHLS